MKKTIFLTTILLLAAIAHAQTQQGFVKTKGRMVNGQLVPGQGLKGATVSIKGRTAVLVNSNDGSFSFPVTEAQFRLDSVKKKGYQLVDSEALTRSYRPSPNPIYLVMETPDQQLQDQLAAERKIRRTLTNQLQQQEDEIEALREQQKLTDEEYRNALQQLYEITDKNEQLVKEMVERYSQIDYDQLSEFDQQVSQYILNGDLIKADSMLRTKGDINERISQLRQHEAVNAREQEELAQRQEQLEQSRLLAQRELEDIANDCYRKYEIFKMQHLNDSAAYYLELRASLDTTQIPWALEATDFVRDYLADIPKAMGLTQLTLDRSLRQYGEWDLNTAHCHHNMGTLLSAMSDFDQALEHFNTAIGIIDSLFGPKHRETANNYNSIGLVYGRMGDWQHALEYCLLSLEMVESSDQDNAIPLISIYNNIGYLYDNMADFEKALVYDRRAIDLSKSIYGESHPSLLRLYNNIGMVFEHQSDFPQALEYLMKALAISKEWFGESHPETALIYSNIATIYDTQGEYQQALEYQLQALEIKQKAFGELHPDCAISYVNLGLVQSHLGHQETAIEYYEKAIDILKDYIPENHPYIAVLNGNIASAYSSLKDYDQAIVYRRKSLDADIETYGEIHPSVACDYDNLGNTYSCMGQGEEALTYHYKALEIYEAVYGDTDQLDIAFVHDNLGFAYTVIGDYEKAMEHYEITLAIKIKLLGEDNYHTQRTKASIEELKEKMK